jgi:hypothetical protein
MKNGPSYAKLTSLDKVVVFMWLFKVVMKFRTFEEDHPAEFIKK